MKIVVRGSSFLGALLGARGNGAVAEPPPLLQLGSAGSVYIGMPAGDVKVRRKELSCETENGIVTAIRVTSGRYKTETGIGVGDSVIALANKYPIRWSDDHVAEVDDLKMKFQIEQNRIVSIVIW